MGIEFKLPNLGEGVSSADVAEILVKEGDAVSAGQIVMELETDKAVVELPCPHAGVVGRILVAEGATINIGQPVMVIEGTATSAAPAAVPSVPASGSKPAATPAVAPAATPGADASGSKPAAAAPSTAPALTPTLVTAPTLNPQPSTLNAPPVPAAPATRRLARELGVDIGLVKGSGPGGRITQDDVQAYVRGQLQQLAVASQRPSRGPSAGGISAPPLPDFTRFGVTVREPMNKIARTAAENLTVSWNVIPHVTQHDKADITDLEAARKRFGEGIGKNGPKVTMTAIVMKALATCLQAFPKFNSSLDPETNEIVFKKFYNIGCAVDTPNGLVVPVIKDCNTKSILTIAGELTELAGKARERKLSIDSMQGATCTVTNLGGLGGIAFTPIVNYPEVCILGMSRSQMELKLDDGKVVERMMLPLSLSYDHRVINGADAARFVTALVNMLADPFQLLAAC